MSPIRPFFLVQLSLLLRFILITTCSPSLNAGGNIQLVLNEVPPAGHCLPVKITWTGGIPPFTISISPEPAGTIGRAGIHDTIPNSRAYVWTPSFPAGASAHIIIIDSTPSRLQVWRDVVVSGSNKTCISQSTSSSVPSQSTTSKVSTFTPPLGSPSPSYNVKSSTTATGATSSLSSTLVVVSGFNSSIATGASVRGKLASSECPTSVPTRTSCHSGPQSIAITATSPAVTSEAAGPSTQSDSGHVSRSRKTLSSGAIFGIVFGSITLLAALALLIYRTRARRRREDLTQACRPSRNISPREAKFEQALAERDYTKKLRLFEPTLDIGTEADRVRSESAWSLLSPVLSESRDDFHSVDTHESFHTANSSFSK